MPPLCRLAGPAALVLLASGALAGPAADRAAEAEALMAEGRTAEALALMRDATALLRAQAVEVGLAAVALTEGEAEGFGLYTPRADAIYAPEEPIRIYAEILALEPAEAEDGQWRLAFAVDLIVQDAAGTTLAEAPGFIEIETLLRDPQADFYANLTYNLTGAPPGDYLLVSTLRDLQSDRTGRFDLAVTIAE